jgi:hypothetical protein
VDNSGLNCRGSLNAAIFAGDTAAATSPHVLTSLEIRTRS